MSRLRLLGGLFAFLPLLGAARANEPSIYPVASPAATTNAPAVPATPVVPLAGLSPAVQQKLRYVMESPSLGGKGQAETFNADPAVYKWLLDNPRVTSKLWKTLGAKVSDVEERDGRFRYTDDNGSEVFWTIVGKEPGVHAWYAEGKVKPALLVPLTSFRAVVVMHYVEGKDMHGKAAIQHQTHFFVRGDSRAVSLVMRVLGKSAPRMTEQYLGQLQTFYGGMAWYLTQDDERARRMYKEIGLPVGQKP